MLSGISSPSVKIGILFGVVCSICTSFEKVGAILFLFGFELLASDEDEKLVRVVGVGDGDAVTVENNSLEVGCGGLLELVAAMTDRFDDGGGGGGCVASSQQQWLLVTGSRVLVALLLG